jgi:hypothetical protein
MYNKIEICQMIARQFDIKQSVIDHIIDKISQLDNYKIISEFKKACGLTLDQYGNNFVINFK